MRAFLALALLPLVLLLAGCAEGGDQGEGTGIVLQDVDNTATEGSISGVVVDSAIRPVGGVNLTLLGPQVTAVSASDGLFVFEGLQPGLYTVSAAAMKAADGRLFLGIQTTAEVRAAETAKMRIVLPDDPTPQPFHTTQKFDGFNQAGNSLVSQAYELFINETAGVPYDSCQCQFYYRLDQPADTHIVEVVWDPSVENPAGDSTGYWAIWDDDGGDYQDDGCDNPCLGRIDGFFPPESQNFHIDIWLDSSWVQVNQAFSVYLTLFYNGAAPEDWSFVDGQA